MGKGVADLVLGLLPIARILNLYYYNRTYVWILHIHDACTHIFDNGSKCQIENRTTSGPFRCCRVLTSEFRNHRMGLFWKSDRCSGPRPQS